MPYLSVTNGLSDRQKTERRQIVSLTVTRDCNLRCKYCYEPFDLRKREYMSLSTAKEIINQYMSADNGFDSEEFGLFGGEPMLNFQLIKELVEWFKTGTWKKKYIFFISTNGTILNNDMKEWLVKNRNLVVVGFSIDGNREAHNLSRCDSYDLLAKNISFFRRFWPKTPAKMTIAKETIPYLSDSILELERMGLLFTANIVFEDIWGDSGEKEELLSTFSDQLERLVEFYSNNPQLEPVEPLLRRHLEAFNKTPKDLMAKDRDCIRYCGAGHEMVMIDVDGTKYPCHRFVPWVTRRAAPTGPINRQQEWMPTKCNSCKLIAFCPTCAGFNWEINGDTGTRTTYHCEAIKLQFLATAKYEAIRLGKLGETGLSHLSKNELYLEKKRLDSIFELLSEKIF